LVNCPYAFYEVVKVKADVAAILNNFSSRFFPSFMFIPLGDKQPKALIDSRPDFQET